MAQFSLSPAVTVKEINLTGYVPNIPSAKTGAILRSDSGPCLDIVSVTSEADLLNYFGKPNAYNYQDWFQCWNFLQYSSSLYVVRPIDANTLTKNAGIGLTGNNGAIQNPVANMYNSRVAEHTLENFNDVSETLYFINKEITSNQRYAIAVCSNSTNFNSQIGLEYSAVIGNTNNTTSVTAVGSPNLATSSQVILNGDKLANVVEITQSSSANSTIKFDRPVSASDVAPFFATVASGGSGSLTVTFNKTGFKLQVGTQLTFNSTAYTVKSIGANASDTSLYDVVFINNSNGVQTPTVAANQIVYSSALHYFGTTSYNVEKNDFGVIAGATTITLQAGFIMQPGVKFSLVGENVTIDGLQVSSVDYISNSIQLMSPCPSGVDSSSAMGLSVSASSLVVDNLIVGINYFDKIYDSGLITKTRKIVTDAAGNNVSLIAQSLTPFNKIFEYPPNWSKSEFGIVVLRKNDSGYYEKYESFLASYDPTAKNVNGANLYVEEVFAKSAKSCYVKVGNKFGTKVDTANIILPKILSDNIGGTTIYPSKTEYQKQVYDASAYTPGDIMQAELLFSDPETFDINILMCHQLNFNGASTIAETRKDCIAVVAPYDYQYLSTHSNSECSDYLLDYYGTQTVFDGKTFTSFGTYSAFYGNMKYQYDKFNNVNRWINLAGDVAGLYAQTDSTNDPWWAPAGTSRGIIKNAIKLAFNANKQNRDDLYVNAINPIIPIPGEGSAVVWGQKTATSTPSAFDRVNVRRLLIHLEKSISTAVNIGLFEFNDSFTRTRLFNILDPFLRSVKARRGLYEYKLIVDASNNTSAVIDQNGLVIDIYLQPTKVAEFIAVNVIVTPTGANFSEYVGTF